MDTRFPDLVLYGRDAIFRTCNGREEAIEAIKQIKYDIVISDYKLPGMNGLEFFRQTEKSIPNAMKI
jgi:two-component SAPR family response regulator